MRWQLAALLASGAIVPLSGTVMAHHSFAMFDQENPIELVGIMQEFKFTSPHTFIILTVREEDGRVAVWNLEGGSPTGLIRDGWSNKSLKPGDELKVKIAPLRSGAPGGAWTTQQINFQDGRPVAASP